MTALEIALLTLAGGLMSLDRVAFLQSMISRPLPVSAVTGLILGEPVLGLVCGLYMELIWLARLPVGGAVPPDDTLAALASVAAATAFGREWPVEARAAAGVLIGIPYGLIGRRLDIAARKANGKLCEKVRAGLTGGDEKAPGKAQARGAANFFMAGLAGSLLAAVTAKPLAAYANMLTAGKGRVAMEIMALILPLVGAGTILGSISGRIPKALFAAGGLAAFAAVSAGLGSGLWDALRLVK